MFLHSTTFSLVYLLLKRIGGSKHNNQWEVRVNRMGPNLHSNLKHGDKGEVSCH